MINQRVLGNFSLRMYFIHIEFVSESCEVVRVRLFQIFFDNLHFPYCHNNTLAKKV